jgi:octaheme c-type cytochrome (tetrathionate reductase family)
MRGTKNAGYRINRNVEYLLAILAAVLFIYPASAQNESTADHTKFKELQKVFKSGPEVTKACLACHTEASKQIHKTKHWTWEYMNPNTNQLLGKKRLLNNLCVAISSNQAACTSCHIGYGWKDAKFDFKSQENVDCLSCHDTTGDYRKIYGMAGHPAYEAIEFPPGSGEILKPQNLQRIAQNVGKSSRFSCGVCHFYSGGGDGVKYGDMSSSLTFPDRATDAHMDAVGLDFTCGTCHMTTGHKIPGSRYAPTAKDRGGRHIRGKSDETNPVTCESCHGNRPHTVETVDHIQPPKGFSTIALAAIVNNHGDRIACQTCHIPAMARGGVPTKLIWDWSKAGRMGSDGKPMKIQNAAGHVVYDSKKGEFTLSEHVIPEYVWFNGKVNYMLFGDKVDKANAPIQINRFEGNPADGKSRIWPVKVMRGVQPYDPVNKMLVVPHTTGTDESSYWKNFDWHKALSAGMASLDAPFSGKVDFIETQMLFPVNHMVAPKEKTLACSECHNKRGELVDGRLKHIKGLKPWAKFELAD